VLMYMAATRTQVYLTADQRERLDRLVRRRGVSLAHLIREALDRYLAESEPDLEEALRSTFGSMPDLEVPSREEWDAGPADRH
jgi:predicted DNA-binding protein